MKLALVLWVSLLTGFTVFAQTKECTDFTGQLRYSTYFQEGGPCCGRSAKALAYQGKVLKQTEHINGGGRGPATTTDSNPNLEVREGQPVNLNNSSIDKARNQRIDYMSMNLALQSKDGQPVLPGGSKPVEVISLLCKVTSNLVPTP